MQNPNFSNPNKTQKFKAEARDQASLGSLEGRGDLMAMNKRKRKWMESNCKFAWQLWMKKKKMLEDQISEWGSVCWDGSRENILKAQTMEIVDRLRFLNPILEITDEVDSSGGILRDSTDFGPSLHALENPSPYDGVAWHVPPWKLRFVCMIVFKLG